ncbi:Follistatin-A [Halotydeus destructor]|nr:Follistatin-A [Halotydeus destructor]
MSAIALLDIILFPTVRDTCSKNFVLMGTFKQASFKMAIVMLASVALIPLVSAGICFDQAKGQESCTIVSNVGQTVGDCCRADGRAAYIDANYSMAEMFFLINLRKQKFDCKPCAEVLTCSDIDCGAHRCIHRDGEQPYCICSRKCSKHEKKSGPICSLSGKTFKNMCGFQLAKKCSDRNLYADYYGNCTKSCQFVTCSESNYCDYDTRGNPHCIPCRSVRKCKNRHIEKNVCGSDRVVYKNKCFMYDSVCATNEHVHEMPMTYCDEDVPNYATDTETP